LAQKLSSYMNLKDKDDQKLCVLSGMSAAMGALFPTPVLGVLMIHELGNPPKSYMESTLLMSIPAIASWMVLFTLQEYTWINEIEPNHFLSMHWKFEKWQCGAAVIMGMVAAALSLVSLLGVGLMKQLLLRIKMRVDTTKLSGTIVISTLGGFLIGLTNYALPLTIGNGHLVSSAIIKGTTSLNPRLLRCSIFGRAFTMAVSMNCGFVGGFVMPLISIGLITGVLCHKQYDDIPLGMAVACFMAAVPSALCPIPFTMLGVSCYVFFLGLQQTIPVFISCIVAYICLTGIGVLGALQERANKNQQKSYDNSFEEEKSLLGGRRSEDEETDVNDSVSIYSKKGPKFSTVASP
jgi:H+/Cl- antiporter ClcA